MQRRFSFAGKHGGKKSEFMLFHKCHLMTENGFTFSFNLSAFFVCENQARFLCAVANLNRLIENKNLNNSDKITRNIHGADKIPIMIYHV